MKSNDTEGDGDEQAPCPTQPCPAHSLQAPGWHLNLALLPASLFWWGEEEEEEGKLKARLIDQAATVLTRHRLPSTDPAPPKHDLPSPCRVLSEHLSPSQPSSASTHARTQHCHSYAIQHGKHVCMYFADLLHRYSSAGIFKGFSYWCQ